MDITAKIILTCCVLLFCSAATIKTLDHGYLPEPIELLMIAMFFLSLVAIPVTILFIIWR